MEKVKEFLRDDKKTTILAFFGIIVNVISIMYFFNILLKKSHFINNLEILKKVKLSL